METRITKYKKYRASLIKQDAISEEDIIVHGKHSYLNNETATLPFNDVLNTLESDKKKDNIKNELNKKRTTQIIIGISIITLVIVGIIVFAIIAFGGK